MNSSVRTWFLALSVMFLRCGNSHETLSIDEARPDIYLTQTPCTDPGSLAYLFNDLPSETGEVTRLIKRLLIHPLETATFGNAIPESRQYEDTIYPTVHAMLSGLMNYDSSGLRGDRPPEHRLVVACLHHSLLFASILRNHGIPVRIRIGFAPYIGQMVGVDVAISHVVCQVWDNDRSRWIWVDPDRQMDDFPQEEFITGAEAWRRWRAGDIDVTKLRSAFFAEEQSILDMLRLDVAYALRDEIMYWGPDGAPAVPDVGELAPSDLNRLDRIAELMPQAGPHLDEIRQLQDSVTFLRSRQVE